jgi:hypothetical protein
VYSLLDNDLADFVRNVRMFGITSPRTLNLAALIKLHELAQDLGTQSAALVQIGISTNCPSIYAQLSIVAHVGLFGSQNSARVFPLISFHSQVVNIASFLDVQKQDWKSAVAAKIWLQLQCHWKIEFATIVGAA